MIYLSRWCGLLLWITTTIVRALKARQAQGKILGYLTTQYRFHLAATRAFYFNGLISGMPKGEPQDSHNMACLICICFSLTDAGLYFIRYCWGCWINFGERPTEFESNGESLLPVLLRNNWFLLTASHFVPGDLCFDFRVVMPVSLETLSISKIKS